MKYLLIIHKYNITNYRQNTTLGKDVVKLCFDSSLYYYIYV
jgi:hypothetical protein